MRKSSGVKVPLVSKCNVFKNEKLCVCVVQVGFYLLSIRVSLSKCFPPLMFNTADFNKRLQVNVHMKLMPTSAIS
jgi:hypothetical protein